MVTDGTCWARSPQGPRRPVNMISRPTGPARGVSATRAPPGREIPVTAAAEHPPGRPRRRVLPPLMARSRTEVTHRSHPVRRGLRGPEAKAPGHRSRTSRRSACRSPPGRAPKVPAHRHRPSPRAFPRAWRTAGTRPSRPVGRSRTEKARLPRPSQACPGRRTPPLIMAVPSVLAVPAATTEPAGHPVPWSPTPPKAPRDRPVVPTTPCSPGGTMAPDIPTPRADPTKP